MKVAVGTTGQVEFIHSDAAVELLGGLGHTTMRRASHVEPWAALSPAAQQNFILDHGFDETCHLAGITESATSWFADMSPVGGRTLGPFSTKAEALQAEVKWIESNALCLTTKTTQQSSRSGFMSFVNYFISLFTGRG